MKQMPGGRIWRNIRIRRGAWGSPSARRWKSPRSTPTPNMPSAASSTMYCWHQTVIGQEAMAQLEMAGDYPDVIVGCTGGGSNFSGIAFPFIGAGRRGGPKPRGIACEPAACPSLTGGKYAYDFGDTGHLTPLVKIHTLGSTFVPPGFHAGGLRQHRV